VPTGRILIVEDNELNRALYEAMLRPEGYELTMATTALEGLQLAESERPEVILMDIGLPVIDGLEATRRLRENPGNRSIRILAVSAHALEGDRQRAAAAGCDGFVSKPIHRATLLAEIRRQLERTS
jgi:two-component system, cell cycle response regulator DivK